MKTDITMITRCDDPSEVLMELFPSHVPVTDDGMTIEDILAKLYCPDVCGGYVITYMGPSPEDAIIYEMDLEQVIAAYTPTEFLNTVVEWIPWSYSE